MIREERVIKAKTLSQAIMLLSKKQLNRFAAVVAWYQVHNNLYYYLDERNTKRLFIDLFANWHRTSENPDNGGKDDGRQILGNITSVKAQLYKNAAFTLNSKKLFVPSNTN